MAREVGPAEVETRNGTHKGAPTPAVLPGKTTINAIRSPYDTCLRRQGFRLTTHTHIMYASLLGQARVLVFGGTSGIGFRVAENALSQGAAVIVSGSRQARVDAAVQRLKDGADSKTASVQGHVCDLSDVDRMRPNLEALLQACDAQQNPLDHVVFTAGDDISTKPIAEQEVETLQRMANVRFFGPMLFGGMATSYMKPSPKSSITLTSGTMCLRPMKNWSPIAAYGSGVEGLMRGLSIDLAPIRINVVSPGAVNTEMFDKIPADRLDGALKMYREASLTGTVGTPEELSEAYMYFMRCSFAAGTVVAVDGGRLVK